MLILRLTIKIDIRVDIRKVTLYNVLASFMSIYTPKVILGKRNPY